jgi:hypothetical protein
VGRPGQWTGQIKTSTHSLIKESYGFLSKFVEVTIKEEFAIITFQEKKQDKKINAQKYYEIAVNEAKKGNYLKSIKLFKRVNFSSRHGLGA